MDFFLDRASNQLVRARGLSSAVSAATAKARDTVRLDFYTSTGATAEDLAEGALLVFALKDGYEEDAVTLALITDWEKIGGETGHYRALLDLNTEPLETAVGDLAKISALGEFSWSEDGGDNWESSNTLALTIVNDVYKGVEGTPLSLPTPLQWLNAVAAYDAGDLTGSVALDRALGYRQRGVMIGNTTLAAPTNGTEGQALALSFSTSGGAWTLDFDEVGMNAEALAALPISLEEDRAYIVEMAMTGGLWALTAIYGPFLVV